MRRYVVSNLGWRENVWYVAMTDEEWAQAQHLSTRRHDDAREHGEDYSRRDPKRTPRDQYNDEQQNFLGRMAFCAATEIPFPEDGQIGIKPGDPRFGIEGRYVVHTVDADDRQLLIRPHEPEDRIYVLGQVLSDGVHVVLVGWSDGREHCDEFSWEPRPAWGGPPLWVIPRWQLHDMDKL
jgi:hypothetical protein